MSRLYLKVDDTLIRLFSPNEAAVLAINGVPAATGMIPTDCDSPELKAASEVLEQFAKENNMTVAQFRRDVRRV
jgi:hypothetical protein